MTLPVALKPLRTWSMISRVSIFERLSLSHIRQKCLPLPKIAFIALTLEPVKIHPARFFLSPRSSLMASSRREHSRSPSSVFITFWNSSNTIYIFFPMLRERA